MALDLPELGYDKPDQVNGEEAILQVENLAVAFDTDAGRVRAVDGVDFSLKRGRVLGIAGESGCGKSVTALSLIRLLPRPVSSIVGGKIRFHGQNLLDLPMEEMHRIRGKKISMIFQEPMTALNPVQPVGRQIVEVFQLHFPKLLLGEMQSRGVAMLEKVGIADPVKIMKKYPHQLSGGMRQRVMIAMALACEPDILIADEPTTALDVTVQAQILDLIRDLKGEKGMSVILITHDLGVIAENCDEVVVMYAGKVAETAKVKTLFKNPCHPYTRGLLTAIPSRAQAAKTFLPTISGNVPSLMDMPDGCRFSDRCPDFEKICETKLPPWKNLGQGHGAACHLL